MSEVQELADEGISTELAEERDSLSSLQKRKSSDISVPPDSSSSSSSSSDERRLKDSEIEARIAAVEHCLYLEGEAEEKLVRRYQIFDQDHLITQLENLQKEKQNRQAMEQNRQAMEQNRQAMELELEKQKTKRMSSDSSSGKPDSTLL